MTDSHPSNVVAYLDKLFSGDTQMCEVRANEWRAVKAHIASLERETADAKAERDKWYGKAIRRVEPERKFLFCRYCQTNGHSEDYCPDRPDRFKRVSAPEPPAAPRKLLSDCATVLAAAEGALRGVCDIIPSATAGGTARDCREMRARIEQEIRRHAEPPTDAPAVGSLGMVDVMPLRLSGLRDASRQTAGYLWRCPNEA